jgi:hypothetical protein
MMVTSGISQKSQFLSPTRQENTPFGNIPATTPQIWQYHGNKSLILATARQQDPDSGNNAATIGNNNSQMGCISSFWQSVFLSPDALIRKLTCQEFVKTVHFEWTYKSN